MTKAIAPAAQSLKHTPGPWHAIWENEELPRWKVYAPCGTGNDWLVCRVSNYTEPDPSGEANAALIASAPALADALEAVLKAHSEAHNPDTDNAAPLSLAVEMAEEQAEAALRAAGRLP